MADLTSLPQSKPATSAEVERYNSRLGSAFFFIYLAVYASYVIINAFWPSLMDRLPFGGLNLAVWFGMALIIGAFLLALLYAWLCQSSAKDRP